MTAEPAADTIADASSGNIRVAISGINGRMGRASARLLADRSGFQLVAAYGRPGAPYIGKDVAELTAASSKTGILVSSRIQDLSDVKVDVLLDISEAEIAVSNAKLALENGVRAVTGTSGISLDQVAELSTLAKSKKLGAMVVPNFSVGAVLMMEFARQAAFMFENAEIVEMHHTGKADAPSGTSLHTMRKMAQAPHQFNQMQVSERELLPGSRGGKGDSGLRVHSLRLPGLISHQEVILGAPGELLTIRHDSFNTDCFIKGILLSLKAVMSLDHLLVGLDTILPGLKGTG